MSLKLVPDNDQSDLSDFTLPDTGEGSSNFGRNALAAALDIVLRAPPRAVGFTGETIGRGLEMVPLAPVQSLGGATRGLFENINEDLRGGVVSPFIVEDDDLGGVDQVVDVGADIAGILMPLPGPKLKFGAKALKGASSFGNWALARAGVPAQFGKAAGRAIPLTGSVIQANGVLDILQGNVESGLKKLATGTGIKIGRGVLGAIGPGRIIDAGANTLARTALRAPGAVMDGATLPEPTVAQPEPAPTEAGAVKRVGKFRLVPES